MKNKETGNTGIGDVAGSLGLSGSAAPIEMMYFHGRTCDGNNYTISGVVENDDLILGLALCADKENFNRARGREISTGRALSQRSGGYGRMVKSFYDHDLDNEFKGVNGFSENYFKGNEIRIFRALVCIYNYFTKKELIREFGLRRVTQLK